MTVDSCVSSAPFASIKEISCYKTEEELLFSIHSVLRIDEIKKIDKKDLLYQVDLKLTANDDQELRVLNERIREDVAGGTGWGRLGLLLIKLSQFDKAEKLYNVLLEQTSNESEKATFYHQLGYIKDRQGDYEEVIEYHEKVHEIWEKTLPPNHLNLATSNGSIGEVYRNMEEYLKALSFYEKSLEIDQKTLPLNHPDLATSYNNIGRLYYFMKENSKALSYLERTLNIYQIALLANHPDIQNLQ